MEAFADLQKRRSPTETIRANAGGTMGPTGGPEARAKILNRSTANCSPRPTKTRLGRLSATPQRIRQPCVGVIPWVPNGSDRW